MKLSEFLKKTGYLDNFNFNEHEIHNVMVNSSERKQNSVFFALRGIKKDGHDFIEEAVNNGAVLCIGEREDIINEKYIFDKNLRKNINKYSNLIYGNPAESLILTGVTGTNGKTSVTYIIENLLKSLNFKTGRAGTINADTIKQLYDVKNTFPEGPLFISYLAECRDYGGEHFVTEVSSHALELGRTDFIDFNFGVWTNLTQDHMDFHQNMDNYFNSKKKLFQKILNSPKALKGGVVNYDCSYGRKIIDFYSNKFDVLTYGFSQGADLRIEECRLNQKFYEIKFSYLEDDYLIKTNLFGNYNALNIMASIGLLLLNNIKIENIIKTDFKNINIPGRMERIRSGEVDVFIDYAHTPDALENVLKNLKLIYDKIVIVFGCGGDRDKSKRPVMGRIASENCLQCIVTDDNPRSEPADKIAQDIIEGMKKKNYTHIPDRREAILKGREIAYELKAALLIAGKGHETYQEKAGVKKYFSDKEVFNI